MSIVDFVEEDQSTHRYAKKSVCIMGGRKVGKTYLARILSDGSIQSDYQETISTQQYSRITENLNVRYVFYDYPALETSRYEEIQDCQCFDIALLLFKDNHSFQDLLNFFETIKEISSIDKNMNTKKYIWKEIRSIFIVYRQCEQFLEMNIDQLFSILKEKIHSFNQSVIIETYSWLNNEVQLSDLKRKLYNTDQMSNKKVVTHQERVRRSSDMKNMPLADKEQANQQRISKNSTDRPKLVEKSTGQSDKKLNPFLNEHQVRENIENQKRKSFIKGEPIQDLFEQWRPSSKEHLKIDQELFQYLSEKKKQLEEEQSVSEDELPPDNIDFIKKERTGAAQSNDKRESKSRKTQLKKVSTDMQRQSKRKERRGTDSQTCFCSIM